VFIGGEAPFAFEALSAAPDIETVFGGAGINYAGTPASAVGASHWLVGISSSSKKVKVKR